MSGRLRVVVATTDGPSTVRRITPEDPDLRSVVCLAGTATALPISTDYDAFVRRPTGVVERDTGHRVCRVDVDRAIHEGRSWQLGLYIAHRLKAAGRLAEDDQPADGVVWATGTVDADLNVGPVERVADKARRSQDLFDGALPVLAVVAAANAEALPVGVEALAIRRMGEVLHHLDLTPPPVRAEAVGRRGVVAVFLLLAFLAAGAWGLWGRGGLMQAGRTPLPHPPVAANSLSSEAGSTVVAPVNAVPFKPAAVTFEVVEARMDGETCGTGAVVDPAVESAPGVCAVAFRATNTGSRPARLWLYGAVQGAVREYASRKRYTELADGLLAPGETGEVRVQLPDWMRRPAIVRGVLILAEDDDRQVNQALVSIDLLSSGEIDTMVAGLRDLGIHVREIFHRVTPAR